MIENCLLWKLPDGGHNLTTLSFISNESIAKVGLVDHSQMSCDEHDNSACFAKILMPFAAREHH